MANVENREAGSLLITTRPARTNLPLKSGQKGQAEDQPFDFLKDVLLKFSGLDKKGSAAKKGNSGDVKGLGQESPDLRSTESVSPLEQLENKDSMDQTISVQAEATGLRDQIEENGDEEQENKNVGSPSFPSLEALFIGREDILKNFLGETANVNSSQSNASLIRQGETADTIFEQSPANGAQVSGPGEGSPGLGNPKGEIAIERKKETGIFLRGTGPDPDLSKPSLFREDEGPVSKPEQFPPVDGATRGSSGNLEGEVRPLDQLFGAQGSGPGEVSPGLGNSKGKVAIARPSDTRIFLQGSGLDSGLSKDSLVVEGEGPVSKPDRSSVNGAQGSGPGEGNPGLGNPKGETAIERPGDTRIFLQGAGPDSGLMEASLLSEGEDSVSKPDSPIHGAQVNGPVSGEGSPELMNPKGGIALERLTDTRIFPLGFGFNSGLGKASLLSEGEGEGSSGLVNSAEEIPVVRPDPKGSLEPKDGLKPHPDDNLLLNKLKTFVEKISQSLTDGPGRNRVDHEEVKSGFKKSMEPISGKDNFQKDGLSSEIIKSHLPQNRPSSDSMMIEKAEGATSEKTKEGQPGLSTGIKENFLDDPRGISAVKDREGSEIIYDIKGLHNKEITPTGENTQGNGPRQTPILPIDPNDPILRESVITEKSIKNNPEPFHHFPKTYESDFLNNQYFSVKKQTSSSMELSLEPAGLGKLDIELSLNRDRLQGQIMVNDKAGKELIERNLPQLFSDLAREGLQIGGFTVSLKHQGRGQNPVPTRAELEEPSLRPMSPEKIVPIQGSHLIHIIV